MAEDRSRRLNITLRPETVARIKARRAKGYRVNVSAILDAALNRELDRLLGLKERS